MELLLIRHALPERLEVEGGAADPELTDLGHEQSRRLAEYLLAESFAAVYSSPLLRARQTAAPLAEAHGLAMVTVDDVAEWDRNSPEYVPVEEMKAMNHPRWQAMVRGEWEAEESPEQFRTRVVTSIEGLIERHPGDRIAIVCHGGVINGYLGHVLGLGVSPGFFYPNYTSIHRVAASRAGHRQVLTINETAHLRGTGLPVGLYQGPA
jgi:probable phosphoglycerate mutase